MRSATGVYSLVLGATHEPMCEQESLPDQQWARLPLVGQTSCLSGSIPESLPLSLFANSV